MLEEWPNSLRKGPTLPVQGCVCVCARRDSWNLERRGTLGSHAVAKTPQCCGMESAMGIAGHHIPRKSFKNRYPNPHCFVEKVFRASALGPGSAIAGVSKESHRHSLFMFDHPVCFWSVTFPERPDSLLHELHDLLPHGIHQTAHIQRQILKAEGSTPE